MKKTLLLASLIFIMAVALNAQTVIEEIVARVNDSIITRGDLNHSKEQLVSELRQQYGDQADSKLPQREKDLLRDAIDQQLLIQKGKDLGINADADVIKRLDEIRKQMNLNSMEDLERAAEAQGVSFEDFKKNLRDNIITQEVIRNEVGGHLQISPKEAMAYYETHKKELEQPEQIHLAEILVSTGDSPDQAKLDAAKAKAEQLLDQIRKGAKFEDVAKQSSDGPTAAQGGDLGLFKRGMLADELEKITFGLKPGEVTDVIRTRQGYVILKVVEHQQGGIPAYKDVENRVMEALYYEKLQPALRTYLTKLREEAFIDIKPGFVDTGASPNQTKPVYTTSNDDGKKAKNKRKKKLGIF